MKSYFYNLASSIHTILINIILFIFYITIYLVLLEIVVNFEAFSNSDQNYKIIF